MWKAAWKSVLGHMSRLVLSTLSVVLGIAFLVGAMTFTGMLSDTFNSIVKGTIADVEVSVEGAYDSSFGAGAAKDVAPLQQADIDRMAQVSGVKSASGIVSGMGVYPLDSNGKVLAPIGGAPTITSGWAELQAYGDQQGTVVRDGHAPTSNDEVMLDPGTLDKLGRKLGDQTEFVTSKGERFTKTIVGTGSWGSGGTVGAQYIFVTVSEAQRLMLDGKTGFQSGWVTTDKDADRQVVADELKTILPSGYDAYTGDFVSDKISSMLASGMSFINTFLTVFAVIGLVVAIFLIVNTFSILVAQRGRELALYRALGASKRQVQRTVIFEALITGLVGSIGGILVGGLFAWGISALMGAMGMDMSGTVPLPSVPVIIEALVVGTLVTILAAWIPSVQAGRVAPVAAMTGQTEKKEVSFGKLEMAATALLIGGSVAFVLAAMDRFGDNSLLILGIGALFMLMGATGIAPLLGRPLTWSLGQFYRAVFKTPGKLADLNVAREPRRAAATASALTIGMTLVATLSVIGESASASADAVIKDAMRADFSISSVTYQPMDRSIIDKLKAVPGVDKVYSLRMSMLAYPDENKRPTMVSGYTPETFDQAIAQHLQDGRVFGTEVGEVMVLQDWADKEKLTVGDSFEVRNPKTLGTMTLKVVGIFSVDQGVSVAAVHTNDQTLDALGASEQVDQIGVTCPADKIGEVDKGLRDAVANYPAVIVQNQQEYADATKAQMNGMLNLIYALLGLAIVIAILGIVNTLVLSVIERTREIGLLRAVGLQRGQLRLMVVLESVAIAVLGAVLGMALGVIFGVGVGRLTRDDGLTALVIPWGRLAIFLGVSVLVGVLAAIWPAYRASKMNILAAIASE